MKSSIKRSRSIILIPACSLLLAAMPVSAHEIYGKAGFLGAGIGYSYGFNKYLNLRTDYATIGTYQRTETVDQLQVKGKMKANQLGFYGDWFPFGGGFRLTAGVHRRTLEVSAEGKAAANGTWTIHDTVINADPNDSVKGKVEFSKTAPYLGIGWGHQSNKPGFGFIADIGVSFGKPKSKLSVSDSVRTKLDAVGAATGRANLADEEIAKQRKELDDTIGGIKIWPQAYIGVSYNF